MIASRGCTGGQPVLTRMLLVLLMLTADLAAAQDREPQPLSGSPQPIFPKAALADAVIGYVELTVDVKSDGKPGSIRTKIAAPDGFGFERAAKDAVARWRFEPLAPGQTGRRVPYTAKFHFRPNAPLPITTWTSAPNASVSFPESRRTLKLTNGWVRTPRWFSDFTFEAEFRLLEPGTRAGILFHAQPMHAPDYVAYRVNLADLADGSAAHGRIQSSDLTLREVAFDQPAAAAAVRPAGEWQTLRIDSVNGTARVTVNGYAVASASEFNRRAGHIGIDVARGGIEVRATQIERRDTYFNELAPVMRLPRTDQERAVAKITGPKLRAEIQPVYAEEPMRRLKQGYVHLEAVVLADGSVGGIRIRKSLDLDLDQSAVAALRQWKFEPAREDGRPVAILVEVEMSFKLK